MKFEVHPSNFEENLDKAKFSKPYEYCLETARLKTLEVADKLYKEAVSTEVVVRKTLKLTTRDKRLI